MVSITAVYSWPNRKIRLASSVCLVADSIKMHNSVTSWWWSPYRVQPYLTRKPRTSQYGKEWLIFMNELQYHFSTIEVIEIAHKLPNGKCRFLIHSSSTSAPLLSAPKSCGPNQNGEKGFFSATFDYLTNRVQITAGSHHATGEENRFLGFRGRSLHLTSLRSRHMKWWEIKFNNNKQC